MSTRQLSYGEKIGGPQRIQPADLSHAVQVRRAKGALHTRQLSYGKKLVDLLQKHWNPYMHDLVVMARELDALAA